MKRKALGLTELIAIGVGGMIGGGIFSVLGLAVGIAGHAAPVAFAIGSLIALAAGYSYVRLALTYRGDGASFTYLQHAFPNYPVVAAFTGWTVILGYVGTLALYAFTFGAYGADLLGSQGYPAVRVILSAAVLLFFMLINLKGARSSGLTEDLVVYSKIILLSLFAVAGLFNIDRDHLVPLFDQGIDRTFMAGALIFVAYEGFQLITNAVEETRSPERNIPAGIYGSIIITSIIYIVLAVVAVGSLAPDEIETAKEYALAQVARPALGETGVILVDSAALLATSSAINSTLFGASHMIAEISSQAMMPRLLSRHTVTHTPWVAVIAMTLLGLLFTGLSGLEVIAVFSSMTFLLVSIGVSIANLRLHRETRSHRGLIWLGLVFMIIAITLLPVYLWHNSQDTLTTIGGLYAVTALSATAYLGFSLSRASTRKPHRDNPDE